MFGVAKKSQTRPDRGPYYHRKPAWRTKVDGLLDVLLPSSCLLCGARCNSYNLCSACRQGLPANNSGCQNCALPVVDLFNGCCGTCLARPPVWRNVYAPLIYEFPVDRLVQRFKYRQSLASGRALAHSMSTTRPPERTKTETLMVPVPLHWSRYAARGFNQAHELARLLSRTGNYSILHRGLVRSQRTRAQQGLDARARRGNLKNAFQWKGPNLQGASAVLIDDVLTTGSTAAECTRTLIKAGAGEVDIWVAARAIT